MRTSTLFLGIIGGVVLGKIVFSFPGPRFAASAVNDFFFDLTNSEFISPTGGTDLDQLAAEDPLFNNAVFE